MALNSDNFVSEKLGETTEIATIVDRHGLIPYGFIRRVLREINIEIPQDIIHLISSTYFLSYIESIEAARKANSIQIWKDVCFDCIDGQRFELAQMCAFKIIIFVQHMHDLIHEYEIGGHFNELINVFEESIHLNRAHQGIYTRLGILYAKYKETQLMEHVTLFWQRLNIPTLIQVCKANLHWKETVFLYKQYDQYHNSIHTIIQHSPSCWDNETFLSAIVRTGNHDIHYRAIDFYLKKHPLYLHELLIELSNKIDPHRVIKKIRLSEQLPLIQPYLHHVQRENIVVVNEAINELLVEEENFGYLRESVFEYPAFDHIALAQQLQNHELIEFRRIAAYLYRETQRWTISIALSKHDGLWKDAIETAALSKNSKLAEELFTFFIENMQKDECMQSCVATCLVNCFDLISQDVIMELYCKHSMLEIFETFN
eukprot:509993_1